MDAVQIIRDSLLKLSAQHTAETLGDRRNYLGASDIGHCPRKVILQRIDPKEHDLASLLRFERGYMTEEIVAKVFTAAGYSFERQVEAPIYLEGVPFLAHIDFVFTSAKAKIKSILEVKSSEALEGPHGSWEAQLFTQMGAIAEKHPEYTIWGAILVVDLANGTTAFFSGYSPNTIIYDGLKQRAGRIWTAYQSMQNKEKIELETEPSLLCGHCDHLLSCPYFAARDVPDLIHFVEDLEALKDEMKKLKQRIEPQKEHLLSIVESIGNVQVGTYLLRKKTQTRQPLDMERLGEFLSDHGLTVDEFRGKPTESSWLEVKKQKNSGKGPKCNEAVG